MSAEVVSIIVAATVLLVTLGGSIFAGFAWLIWRMDKGFDKIDERFDELDHRFDELDQRFDKLTERFDKADQRFDRLHSGPNDVPVSVAWLERSRERQIFPH